MRNFLQENILVDNHVKNGVNCSALGEVESMIKFQQEFDTDGCSIYETSSTNNAFYTQSVTLGSKYFLIKLFLPADNVKMPHSASASGLPPAGLLGPSELPDLGGWVAAGGADLLLDMEGHLATPPAQGVRLVTPLSKGTGTLGHDEAGLVF